MAIMLTTRPPETAIRRQRIRAELQATVNTTLAKHAKRQRINQAEQQADTVRDTRVGQEPWTIKTWALCEPKPGQAPQPTTSRFALTAKQWESASRQERIGVWHALHTTDSGGKHEELPLAHLPAECETELSSKYQSISSMVGSGSWDQVEAVLWLYEGQGPQDAYGRHSDAATPNTFRQAGLSSKDSPQFEARYYAGTAEGRKEMASLLDYVTEKFLNLSSRILKRAPSGVSYLEEAGLTFYERDNAIRVRQQDGREYDLSSYQEHGMVPAIELNDAMTALAARRDAIEEEIALDVDQDEKEATTSTRVPKQTTFKAALRRRAGEGVKTI